MTCIIVERTACPSTAPIATNPAGRESGCDTVDGSSTGRKGAKEWAVAGLSTNCWKSSLHWDNGFSHQLNPNNLTREDAIEKATALARAEMDKLDKSEQLRNMDHDLCKRVPSP